MPRAKRGLAAAYRVHAILGLPSEGSTCPVTTAEITVMASVRATPAMAIVTKVTVIRVTGPREMATGLLHMVPLTTAPQDMALQDMARPGTVRPATVLPGMVLLGTVRPGTAPPDTARLGTVPGMAPQDMTRPAMALRGTALRGMATPRPDMAPVTPLPSTSKGYGNFDERDNGLA